MSETYCSSNYNVITIDYIEKGIHINSICPGKWSELINFTVSCLSMYLSLWSIYNICHVVRGIKYQLLVIITNWYRNIPSTVILSFVHHSTINSIYISKPQTFFMDTLEFEEGKRKRERLKLKKTSITNM